MSLEHDKRAIFERRRNLLYLIAQYLDTNGLNATKQTLIDEATLRPSDYEICDNIDLDNIYLEFVSYYRLKFGKSPKIVKRLEATSEQVVRGSPNGENHMRKQMVKKTRSATSHGEQRETPLGVSGSKCLNLSSAVVLKEDAPQPSACGDGIYTHNERIRDCASFIGLEIGGYKGEWKELAEHVYRNLFTKSMAIGWDNVLGADTAKMILKESVLLPLEYPELFSSQHPPWRGLLVHGVPGVGKTLLAKALCSETEGTISFFNITPSSIMSKWRGESEKLLKILFEVANQNAPSVIFIDEIDSFASKRDTHTDHEATKRFKSEFLTLLDGFSSDKLGVFVLVTSNLPWEIDPAFLRRFERKILLDLPTATEREQMLKQQLSDFMGWPEKERTEFVEATTGFTGDDIRIACKEASFSAIRSEITANGKPSKATVRPEYLRTAISHIQPVDEDVVQKHRNWNDRHGNRI